MRRSPFAPIHRNLLRVPGLKGAHLTSSEIDELRLSIPVYINPNGRSMEDIEDELASWLITDEPCPLVYPNRQGKTYYALFDGAIDDFEDLIEYGEGTLHFVCPDPFKYGPERTAIFPQDAVSLTNEGTVEADPIFELEVLEPVTFALIQNQDDEYQMIGRPANVTEEIVDTRTLLLEERGDTLDTWSDSPTEVDGTVSGHLSTDGEGITVPNYGSGDEWHGPALIKEVPLTQDFEVQMHLQGRTIEPGATFRIEFYLFDESMNVLGKMAVNDSSRSTHQKRAEGRVGPFVGRGINYLISSQNYQYSWDFFFGMVRMRRIGKRFEFYVTRIANDGARHVWNLDTSFMDNAEEFQGRLKYVQIHIGKYSGTPNAYAPKINFIRVFKLEEATIDQTPYIANEGDIITFDHKDDEILINGEDRKDLKDFGASFFKLAKGSNQLVVQPSDSFNTSIKYRERFR